MLAALGNQFAAGAADGAERMVVDFTARQAGNLGVQEFDQAAQNAAFCLAAQSQEDEIVPRQDGIGNLRENGFFVAMNAGEEWLARLEFPQQVRAHFIFYGLSGVALACATPPFTQRGCFDLGLSGHRIPHIGTCAEFFARFAKAALFSAALAGRAGTLSRSLL